MKQPRNAATAALPSSLARLLSTVNRASQELADNGPVGTALGSVRQLAQLAVNARDRLTPSEMTAVIGAGSALIGLLTAINDTHDLAGAVGAAGTATGDAT